MQEVKQLLNDGADPNAANQYKQTVVDVAVYRGNIKLLTLLAKHKSTTQETKDYALCMCALHGYTKRMGVLLDNDANINAQPEEEPTPKAEETIQWATSYQTPLHTAATAGQQTTVKLLLSRDADPTIKNHPLRGAKTPAQVAATDEIKILLSKHTKQEEE